jgi:hypothetical protein
LEPSRMELVYLRAPAGTAGDILIAATSLVLALILGDYAGLD